MIISANELNKNSMTTEEIENRIEEIENRMEELKEEIEYEYRRMDCCGYGSSDLRYVDRLEDDLANLAKELKEMEDLL